MFSTNGVNTPVPTMAPLPAPAPAGAWPSAIVFAPVSRPHTTAAAIALLVNRAISPPGLLAAVGILQIGDFVFVVHRLFAVRRVYLAVKPARKRMWPTNCW